MADRTLAKAPLRTPGEKFRCRVDVEDVIISVEGDATSSTTGLFWEEVRMAGIFNGITQRTRWITLPVAIDEAKEELQKTGAPSGGLLPLPYTAFNNLSYEVEFTAGEATQMGNARGGPSVTAPVRTVKPKRFHLMEFVVEAQNQQRLYSFSGGQSGDQAPTSGNMEAISASLNKGTARVSAWTRSLISKLGSTLDASHSSKVQKSAAPLALQSHAGSMASFPPAANAGDNVGVHEGTYVTVVKNIDASHAYNSPGGRQRFCFVVKPASRGAPEGGTGTPMSLAFTLVAHFSQVKSVPRDFHNFAIVADQFVLDFSKAARELPPAPKGVQQQQPIVGYSFGYTANTSSNPDGLEAASQTVSVAATVPSNASDAETVLRAIDFDRLHTREDERQRTAEDYKKLPTSCCIVSGPISSRPASRLRMGNRIVCESRFKTSPDGLCKPSFKCQFAVSLMRYYGNNGESTREAGPPIDLAALLNQEVVHQRIRAIKFSLGEVLYLRLRRFCFAEPELHRTPLLMPYDYNNSGVDLAALSSLSEPRISLHSQSEQRRYEPQGDDTRALCADEHRIRRGSHPAEATPGPPTSDSVPPSPQNQRSGSGSPLAAARKPENPFLSLEPKEPLTIDFGSSEAGGPVHTPVQPFYTIMPTTSSTCRGPGFDLNLDTPPAFEMTLTEPNPFFSLQPQIASGMQTSGTSTDALVRVSVERNLYDFGSPDAPDDEGGVINVTTSAFELTPL